MIVNFLEMPLFKSQYRKFWRFELLIAGSENDDVLHKRPKVEWKKLSSDHNKWIAWTDEKINWIWQNESMKYFSNET